MLRLISSDMEMICFIHHFPQISIPLGMYSIVFMNKMDRLSFLSDI